MTDAIQITTYDQLMGEFFRLYNEKDYEEAYRILQLGKEQFPEQNAMLAYNSACALSLAGRSLDALSTLESAYERGYWFREKLLRDDEDFASLRGQPQFEDLIARFKVGYQKAAASAAPHRLTFVPAIQAPYPLLMALHGNQNNAARSVDYWKPAVSKGYLLSVPQSGQLGISGDSFVWDDEAQSLAELKAHYAELGKKYSIDKHRAIIGGFSMGGRLAALIGLAQPFPVRGFIAVGPYLAGKLDEMAALIESARERGTRAYLIIGDEDRGSYEDVMCFAEMLKAHQLPYQLKVYPGLPHVFPPDFDQVLSEALSFILD